MSDAKRKSVRMENYRYYVFDMLTVEEFETCESQVILSERLKGRLILWVW